MMKAFAPLHPLLNRFGPLLPSVLLLGGFLMDVFTFHALRVDVAFVILGIYALVAAVGVVYGQRGEGWLHKSVPLVLQFTFGALLSSAFLFYWYGGATAASWPVILVMVALMAVNERFRRLFLHPLSQFGVFVFVFFSYCTLLFPFLLHSISAWVFLLGGAVATVCSLLVAEAIARTHHERRPLLGKFRAIAVGIYAAFVALYFLNFIPPIPLSIRDAGVYHDIKGSSGQYQLQGEPETFLQRMWPGQTVRLERGGDGRIYAYTAIYAPTNLSTTIFHAWQRYDGSARQWVDVGRSSYPAHGGREGGYRGYSYRTITAPGRWRVIVETARGQELGRLYFRAVE